MLHKIRINDLARELEVKSKAILDVLPKVGVTEKKTHSSSIEEDEAERVKKYFAEHEPSTSRGSRNSATADEFKPKIDLSHISKPGDVLKAITQRAAQPAAPVRTTTPPNHAAPPAARPPVAPPSPAPPSPVASTHPVAPAEPKPAPRFITPQSVARPPAVVIMPPKPPAPPVAPQGQAPAVSQAAKPSEAKIENQVAVLDQPEVAAPSPDTNVAEVPFEAEKPAHGSARGSIQNRATFASGGSASAASIWRGTSAHEWSARASRSAGTAAATCR
jgi:translation initiation factor IF-2